jgi:NDP-sugar pyrophosphorylase family protein
MVARYQQGDCAGVIAATPGEDVTKGAILLFDPHFFLKHLIEKPSLAQLDQLRQQGWLKPGEPLWYNSGIYLFPPAVFEFTARLKKSPRGEYELTDAVTALIEARHRLAGLAIEGRWVDVRDPEVLARLEAESRE